jgi:LysM repeat protein
MPKSLADFPRPVGDNGRGLQGYADAGWNGGAEGYAHWIRLLGEMRVKWFAVADQDGESIPFCEQLLEAGIFPIVRIVRRDPPPNNSPEPNPGHIGPREEATLRRLIAVGVRYFETNYEPDQARAWKQQALPGDPIECARLVALNWLFDARMILEAGGLPALVAISAGGDLDLIGALVALGRRDILLEGAWIALHNSGFNRPLHYPDDPVNRTGQPLTAAQYSLGPFTEWAWWQSDLARAQTLDEVNALRASNKNPAQTFEHDHACFREFEFYNQRAVKYLGRSIPIISTAGGYAVGNRHDTRYPRITPELQRDWSVALFDYMQKQAPDYYFAATPSLLIESPTREAEAWHSAFWQNTFRAGTNKRMGLPALSGRDLKIGAQLPVIEAVRAMPSLARRLPGRQPAPPAETLSPPEAVVPPTKPAPMAVPAPPVSVIATQPEPPPPPPAVVAGEAKPPPRRYIIQPGDTIYKIARQFGIAWETIAQANDIATPNLIHAGQMLVIPATPGETRFPEVPLPPEPARAAESENEQRQAEATARLRGPQMPPTPRREMKQPAPPRAPQSRQEMDALDWDPRLDAVNVRVEEAKVPPGQMYWRLIRAGYESPEESSGKHQIGYTVLDENGAPCENQRVWQGWPEDKTDAATDARGEATIPIWASYSPEEESGPYAAWVDGAPCDRVVGMGLPLKRHVNFLLTWKKVTRGK